MRFQNPEYLYILIVVPIFYMILVFSGKIRIKELVNLGNIKTLNRFSRRNLEGGSRGEAIYLSLALLFFILALARPQAGTRLESVKIIGSDIYIAIDISKSMKAEDVKPSRIERAKIDTIELIESLHGDRVGLIFFAGDAFVQCPLTVDYEAVLSFIDSLGSETAVASGTSLFAPINVALKSLKSKANTYAILLILSDGENVTGNPERAVKEAKKRAVKIFSIGIGTKDGAPIPLYDDKGNRTGYKKSSKGDVVITKLSDSTLKSISRETGGYYFESDKRFKEIKKFLSTVGKLKKREFETKKYTVYEERFQFPLAVGIVFFLLYIFSLVKERKRSSEGFSKS